MTLNKSSTTIGQIKAHHYPIKLMGCGFVLTAVDHSPQRAWDAIRAGVREINRIENRISSWKVDSETSRINRQAGKSPVKVSRELFQLIERSLKVSEISGGAFDISGNLSRYYWNFDQQAHEMLSENKIHELRDRINYRLIQLDAEAQTVFLQKEGMSIGFGGIGKGYAAYRASQIMQELGVASGLINASGDLMAWGQPPGKNGWDIHIPDPQNREHSLLQFSIPNGSIVTSGSFENYTLIDGKRYSHIIDPRTGLPVDCTKNVSIVCPNPEFADALATAVSVLGAEEGIRLIDRLNGVEGIVIDQADRVFYSKSLQAPG